MYTHVDWKALFEREQGLRNRIERWNCIETISASELKIKEKQLKRLHSKLKGLEIEYAEQLALALNMKNEVCAVAPDSSVDHATKIDGTSRRAKGDTDPDCSTRQFQEETVLQALRDIGHNPLQLPPVPRGKPWVKAAARMHLKHREISISNCAFNKTWERLRKKGRICEVTDSMVETP